MPPALRPPSRSKAEGSGPAHYYVEPGITSSYRAAPAAPATGAFIGALMPATMVAGIVSSLGAPLLPDVARTMHVSLSSAQWSLTVALLAGAVSAPTLGRLGDRRYRRDALVGELIIVFIGSLIAGFANSLPLLIVGRVMQGTGIALAATLAGWGSGTP